MPSSNNTPLFFEFSTSFDDALASSSTVVDGVIVQTVTDANDVVWTQTYDYILSNSLVSELRVITNSNGFSATIDTPIVNTQEQISRLELLATASQATADLTDAAALRAIADVLQDVADVSGLPEDQIAADTADTAATAAEAADVIAQNDGITLAIAQVTIDYMHYVEALRAVADVDAAIAAASLAAADAADAEAATAAAIADQTDATALRTTSDTDAATAAASQAIADLTDAAALRIQADADQATADASGLPADAATAAASDAAATSAEADDATAAADAVTATASFTSLDNAEADDAYVVFCWAREIDLRAIADADAATAAASLAAADAAAVGSYPHYKDWSATGDFGNFSVNFINEYEHWTGQLVTVDGSLLDSVNLDVYIDSQGTITGNGSAVRDGQSITFEDFVFYDLNTLSLAFITTTDTYSIVADYHNEGEPAYDVVKTINYLDDALTTKLSQNYVRTYDTDEVKTVDTTYNTDGTKATETKTYVRSDGTLHKSDEMLDGTTGYRLVTKYELDGTTVKGTTEITDSNAFGIHKTVVLKDGSGAIEEQITVTETSGVDKDGNSKTIYTAVVNDTGETWVHEADNNFFGQSRETHNHQWYFIDEDNNSGKIFITPAEDANGNVISVTYSNHNGHTETIAEDPDGTETWIDAAGIQHTEMEITTDIGFSVNETTTLGFDLVYTVNSTTNTATIAGTFVASDGTTFNNVSASSIFDVTLFGGDGGFTDLTGTAVTVTGASASLVGNSTNDGYIFTYADSSNVVHKLAITDDAVMVSNELVGTASDDTIVTNSETLSVQAGDGFDTAVFSGDYADYTFVPTYSLLKSYDASGNLMDLSGVERLQFDDGIVNLSLTGGASELQVNTTTSSHQFSPDTAVFSDGGFIVVWNSKNGDTYSVNAQRFDSNGDPDGDELVIDSGRAIISDSNPSVAVAGNGNYAISFGYSGSYSKLILYNDSNEEIANVNSYVYGPDNGVKTAATGDLLWSRGSTSTLRIYSQQDLSNIKDIAGYDQSFGEYDYIGNNQYISFNESSIGEYRQLTAYLYEYSSGYVHFDSNYHKIGSIQSATEIRARDPVATGLEDGGYVIVWQSRDLDSSISVTNDIEISDYDIYGQRYDYEGNVVGTQFLVNTYSDNHQTNPDIAGLGDGGFVVIWESYAQDGSLSGIYGQRYNVDGNADGAEFRVNDYSSSHQDDPSLTALANGGFVVSWESFGQDGSGDGIFAKVYDADGNALPMMSLGEINDTSPILTSFTMSEQTAKSDIDEDSYYEYDTSIYFVSVDDNGLLSYSATLASGLALPDWINIDSTTGVLSGTPSDVDIGVIEVLVTATNPLGESVSDSYVLTVNDVNNTPTIDSTMPDIVATIGDDENTLDIDPSNFFSDADGDVLTYTVTSERPDGSDLFTETLSQWNSAEGVISNEELGEWLITVNASDGQASTSQAFNLLIEPEPLADQPLTFTVGTLSAKNASIEKYGQDFSTNPGDTVIKLTLTADMANVTDAGILSITGAELDLNIDWSQFEAFTYTDGSSQDFQSINAITTPSVWQTYTDETTGVLNKLVVGSIDTAAAPAKILVDNVDSSGIGVTDRPSVLELGSIYLKPVDGLTTVDFSYEGLIVTNEVPGGVTQASTSTSIDTKLMDAVIHTVDNQLLDNLTFHYYKDGVDTGISTLVEDGGIKFSESIDFDIVKLSVDNAYQSNLNILDMYGVLNSIGSTIDTYAEHAADTDNHNGINILDMYAVLDGIGQGSQTFDLVDQNGNLVTSLNTDQADIANWTIIANGNVDMSGGFEDTYVVQVDIV